MRVTLSAAALFAFISAVVAQTNGFDAIYTPTKNEAVPAGSTYTITWDYSTTYPGTISIQLLQGDTSGTLQLGAVIASGIDNAAGMYSWAVDSSLGVDATYGLKIIYDVDASVYQYSNPFGISPVASATGYAASAMTTPAVDSESTVYQTKVMTITSCAADVTNCPAHSTSVTSTLVVATPYATSAAPSVVESNSPVQDSGSAPSMPYPTAAAPTGGMPVYPQNNGTASAYGTGVTTMKTTASAGLSTSKTASMSTSTAAATTPTDGPVLTAGAPRIAAGSLALVGGLVAAFFAL